MLMGGIPLSQLSLRAKYRQYSNDTRTISQREYDEETGRIGEEFVYEQLQKIFAKTAIKWLRELGEKYANHDFEVVHNGKTILIQIFLFLNTNGNFWQVPKMIILLQGFLMPELLQV